MALATTSTVVAKGKGLLCYDFLLILIIKYKRLTNLFWDNKKYILLLSKAIIFLKEINTILESLSHQEAVILAMEGLV